MKQRADFPDLFIKVHHSRAAYGWIPYVYAVLGALLWLVLLALTASGANQKRPPAASKPPAPPALLVVFSGELNGYLTPCGCAKPMLGGLPRRARYFRTLAPTTAFVRVENGDLTQALNRQDELKAETLVEMLNHLQYDAVNLGEKDFRLGAPYLLSLQDRFKGAFLCANARRADGAPLFKEFAVVRRTVGGRAVRIVLVGLLSEQFAASIQAVNPDVTVEPAAETLKRLEPAAAAQGDIHLLFYHGPKAEAEALAGQFPRFQLVVCAHEGDHPLDTERAGNTVLACSGQDGKYIGTADFGLSNPKSKIQNPKSNPVGVQYVALGPAFAEDPRLLQVKQTYLDRVAAEDLLGKVVKVPTANGDAFAGTAACVPCHPAAHSIWTASAHARAMRTLVKAKHDRDPECVTCHVVGLERQGGFVSAAKTPHLQDVGCESCHGAAAKHVQDPKTPLPKAGSASCLQCHVPEHSPHFDFAPYWEKIKH